MSELTNDELISKVFEWVHKLAESGGRAWTLTIPADPRRDPDLLIVEVCNRFRAALQQREEAEVENEAYRLYPDSEHGPINAAKKEQAGEVTFEVELRALLYKHSMENESSTPDFALAEYLLICLGAYNRAVQKRNKFWDLKKPKP